MKFISVLFVVLVLYVSWNWSQHETEFDVSTHNQLQLELADFIQKYVRDNLPGVSNIIFHHVWTEPMTKGMVKASFEYSFDLPGNMGPASQSVLNGFALLAPSADRSGFILEHIEIANEKLEFKEGTTITPGDSSSIKNDEAEPETSTESL
ncbi:MAG: hypothetical protein COT74_09580 [Bdellovibrionales bacterium CG10_big_fil_rev_8_21_14_0_10_45_34]|nr:MAG: hypothetical protein COT74_09580 [Bdellovibrionales bacterium CG10_big_fil_rev_8_21_14_0_10_45_34]